jgi:hypothetical protein
MRLVKQETLIDPNGFCNTDVYHECFYQIQEAISRVVWPPGNTSFVIYPAKHANGVKPIKSLFLQSLADHGWDLETKVHLGVTRRPGPIDATMCCSEGLFAVEWETGNISSSHRALNKMTIGILHRYLIGGILVVPTRELYEYLTDRVGNYRELAPYFDVWRSVVCDTGHLSVIAVEHDAESVDVVPIPKGTDGWAKI